MDKVKFFDSADKATGKVTDVVNKASIALSVFGAFVAIGKAIVNKGKW